MNKIVKYEKLIPEMKELREKELEKIYKKETNIDYNFFGLDIYNFNNTFKNTITKKILLQSKLDENISLTREQYKCLEILENDNLLLSAPTSFGKTFIIQEYIKRREAEINNIIFIVPTIALMNELLKKFDKNFPTYNIIFNSFEKIYEKNIFIMVHERTNKEFIEKIIEKIGKFDLLVIDELYKLSRQEAGVRLISMNNAYLHLIKNSKKICLLTPFTRDVNFQNNSLDIVKYITNFSPVYNNVEKVYEKEWNEFINDEATLYYFDSPKDIMEQINIINQMEDYNNLEVDKIIEWMKENIYEKWYYINFLKKGYAIHHGKTPLYLRKYFESEYNKGNIKKMFCTSTLAEGINTPTNNMIICKTPKTSFKLNNLIGRVGRLNPKNPKIGSIKILDKEAEKLYDPYNWELIEIVAETGTDDIVEHDEITYLDKKDEMKEKELKEEINKFLNTLNKNYDDISKFDYEYNIIKRINELIEEEDLIKVLKEPKEPKEYIDVITKIIKFRSYNMFSKDRVGVFASYKKLILDILFDKKIKRIVQEFQIYNKKANPENINNYIEAYFILENYVKYNFIKILPYFEMFDNVLGEDYKNLEEKCLKFIRNYSIDRDHLEMILLDLGIFYTDVAKIKQKIFIPENEISIKRVIWELKKKYRDIKPEISSISQKNIEDFIENN